MSKKLKIALCGAGGAAAAGLAVLLYCFPPTQYRFWPPCIFHEVTGLYCPGCGNTRALAALLHGDFAESFSQNILFIPAVLTIVCLLIWHRLTLKPVVAYTILFVLLGFMFLRNLPWYPFTLLAPH